MGGELDRGSTCRTLSPSSPPASRSARAGRHKASSSGGLGQSLADVTKKARRPAYLGPRQPITSTSRYRRVIGGAAAAALAIALRRDRRGTGGPPSAGCWSSTAPSSSGPASSWDTSTPGGGSRGHAVTGRPGGADRDIGPQRRGVLDDGVRHRRGRRRPAPSAAVPRPSRRGGAGPVLGMGGPPAGHNRGDRRPGRARPPGRPAAHPGARRDSLEVLAFAGLWLTYLSILELVSLIRAGPRGSEWEATTPRREVGGPATCSSERPGGRESSSPSTP